MERIPVTRFPVGALVRLRHDVDRYPHFIAPADSIGVVVDVGDSSVFAVRLDEPLPGAEDWENEVHWSNDEDPADDLELEASS
jgi:hypothetical protein